MTQTDAQVDKHTVIIADDHPIFRKGLREVIDASYLWHVVAEAETGTMALKLFSEHQPDLIILDISMGNMNGLDVAEKILSDYPDAKCIMMTMYREKAFCQRAMNAGVMGYLVKDDASADIIMCLEHVSQGKPFVSQSMGEMGNCCPKQALEDNPEIALSKKELVILRAIATLKTNQEIAKEQSLSVRTVQNHRQNISKKLNLSGRQALLQYAVKWQEKTNSIKNTN